jgi:alkanesulfonate monooxygenase SsuD/methylene tetrahydromethanopterin reductase-like flavin-dependent oxidoreductase (luciferase family)
MDLGIGLPATVPGVDRRSLIDWARNSEQQGFASLGTVDRIVYPNYEPLVSLAAAAAVTERIRLTTAVLLGPLRTNVALLAKEIATIDSLCEGRFVLGIALGARADDYEVSGVELRGRGERLDGVLERLKRIWSGGRANGSGVIGPQPAREGGPPILVGGSVEASFERVARFGDGWIMGGQPPEQFAQMAPKVDEAWEKAGRAGRPRKAALTYFSLGPRARENADAYINDYYGWLGSETAAGIAGGVLTSEEMVRDAIGAFEQLGCDELIMFPCSTEVEQVDLLASASAIAAVRG